MIGLVDADILLYKACFVMEKTIYLYDGVHYEYKKDVPKDVESIPCKMYKPLEEGVAVLSNLIRGIQEGLYAHFMEDVKLEYYLTGRVKSNYRYKLSKDYKANRPKKPECFGSLRDYMHKEYLCFEVEGQEPDDEIGIRATLLHDQAIIITLDKDLDCIPGWHYHIDKKSVTLIDRHTADNNFLKQLITGDRTDNVSGIPNYGPKKAAQLVDFNDDPMEDIKELYLSCGYDLEALLLTGRLLWIRRMRGQMWHYDFHSR